MGLSRRGVLSSFALLTGGHLALGSQSFAQSTPEASPQAVEPGTDLTTPGYAIARVRALTDSAHSQAALFSNVMADFLPQTRTAHGYGVCVFAFADDDPAQSTP